MAVRSVLNTLQFTTLNIRHIYHINYIHKIYSTVQTTVTSLIANAITPSLIHSILAYLGVSYSGISRCLSNNQAER